MKLTLLNQCKTGMNVTGFIYEERFHGKLLVENNKVFICQNIRDGSRGSTTLGYNYGWCIYESYTDVRLSGKLRLIPNDVSSLYSGNLTPSDIVSYENDLCTVIAPGIKLSVVKEVNTNIHKLVPTNKLIIR